MAKKVYEGINGTARNIKDIYIGIGGTARKVKKAYIGVNGVAREFWSKNSLQWYRGGDFPSSLGGISWYNALCYGNGKFVAICRKGIAYSTDGINWSTGSQISFDTNPLSVAYGNGKFITIDRSYIYYSTNGLNWNSVASNPFYQQSGYAAYGGGKFVILFMDHNNSNNKSLYSTDGINWSYGTMTPIPSSPDEFITCVGYGDGKFVAGSTTDGGWYWISTDGVSWQQFHISNAEAMKGFQTICYGEQQKRFFASTFGVGVESSCYYGNGSVWLPTEVCSNTYGAGVSAYGNGKYVVANSRGKSDWSPNGYAMYQGEDLPIDSIYALCYGNGKIIAVSSAGETAYTLV